MSKKNTLLGREQNDGLVSKQQANSFSRSALEKKFYTSINSMSMSLETIFLPPALKMCNNVNKNMILMTKLEL